MLFLDFYIICEPGFIIICGKVWREVPNNDWGARTQLLVDADFKNRVHTYMLGALGFGCLRCLFNEACYVGQLGVPREPS